MFGYLVLEGTEGAKLIKDICINNIMMNESNLKSQVSSVAISSVKMTIKIFRHEYHSIGESFNTVDILHNAFN